MELWSLDVGWLPVINAILNAGSATFLVLAFFFIRQKKYMVASSKYFAGTRMFGPVSNILLDLPLNSGARSIWRYWLGSHSLFWNLA
jgi:hypothetical protein